MVTVEIWSDFVCPFCYIGKRRFEAALERLPRKEEFRLVWKSFQLDPSGKPAPGTDLASVLAAKYGGTRKWAEERIAQVARMAAGEGLSFDMARAIPANTFDAHRLSHLAGKHGLREQAQERLFANYFIEGKNIADPAELARLAAEIGLDGAEAAATLAGSDYGDDVRRDEEEARKLGINAVPCFVFDRDRVITGAQPAEVFSDALADILKAGAASR